MQQTIAQRLAQFDSRLAFDDIPAKVVEKTKLLILDTLGICLGSTRLDFGEAVLGVVAGWGGTPESTAIGSSRLLSGQNAAFCNGVLGHGQDYDDTHTESVVHPSAALVPVALACGERRQRGGKDVLAALISGLETSIRLGLPALNKFHLRGFHTTSVCATFGSAMIAARLDGLAVGDSLEALGIGGSFCSGLLECVPATSGAKRLHAGWAGHCGIIATDLAKAGYTGPATVFEGKLGVYNSFLRGETLDLDTIFADLGERWEVLNIRPKLYPCCHYLQSFLDCAQALRTEFGIRPKDIAKIECRISAGATNMVCEPWAKKIAPKTGYDARFSLPYAVAVMLTEGKAGAAEFSEAYFEDPDIRELMGKTSYAVDPDHLVKDMPGWLEITLVDGTKRFWEVPRVRGDAANPVSQDELLEKFYTNTDFLGRDTSRGIANRILEIERLDDIGVLMADLRAPF
jgi:2-methylcitrate dehydratase PrpD